MLKKAFIITSVKCYNLVHIYFSLLNTEGKKILQLQHLNVVPALATVGLSADLTDKLTEIGKLIIIVLMFMGRIRNR